MFKKVVQYGLRSKEIWPCMTANISWAPRMGQAPRGGLGVQRRASLLPVLQWNRPAWPMGSVQPPDKMAAHIHPLPWMGSRVIH